MRFYQDLRDFGRELSRTHAREGDFKTRCWLDRCELKALAALAACAEPGGDNDPSRHVDPRLLLLPGMESGSLERHWGCRPLEAWRPYLKSLGSDSGSGLSLPAWDEYCRAIDAPTGFFLWSEIKKSLDRQRRQRVRDGTALRPGTRLLTPSLAPRRSCPSRAPALQ